MEVCEVITAHSFSNSASLFVFFRYQTSIMSLCCSCRQTYRQITRKLSYLWGPLWYLWADGMGSSSWGSFNGLSKPLSQKSCWPLRSLRDFLRGKSQFPVHWSFRESKQTKLSAAMRVYLCIFGIMTSYYHHGSIRHSTCWSSKVKIINIPDISW